MSDLNLLNKEDSLVSPKTNHKNLQNKLKDLLQHKVSKNTRKAYRNDLTCYSRFCKKYDLDPFPASPQQVAYYITDIEEKYKLSTVERRLATLSKFHEEMDVENPIKSQLVKDTINSLKRTRDTNKSQAKPLFSKHIKLICDELGESIIDRRDRCILLLGFSSSCRRSELVSLTQHDVQQKEEGLELKIDKSKTDQEGKGRLIGICYGSNPQYCPVRNTLDWIEFLPDDIDHLFPQIDRHGNIVSESITAQSISLIVKKRVEQIGLISEGYSAHSLRAGFVSTAMKNGASMFAVMEQTGHKSERVLRSYYRKANLFTDNASAKLEL